MTDATNAGTQRISSKKRLCVPLGRFSNGLGVLYKTRWAIHDATNIQKLVNHVRDLVDGIMEDVLGWQGSHDEKVQNDIGSTVDDNSEVRLVSVACSDVYPNWSDIASRAIDISETGIRTGYLTNDSIALDQSKEYEVGLPDVEPRSDWGFRDHQDSSQGIIADLRPCMSTYNVVCVSGNTTIYFVLTEQRRNEGTDPPYDLFELGGTSFSNKYCFVSPSS